MRVSERNFGLSRGYDQLYDMKVLEVKRNLTVKKSVRREEKEKINNTYE